MNVIPHVTGNAKYGGVSSGIAQLGHPNGQLSLKRIRRAVALGPDVIQVVLPDWLPLSPDEVLAAVGRMARVADGVPLVLYNPPCAKTQLDPESFARLAGEVPALVGIKVPGGDDAWFHRMTSDLGTRLATFVAGHTLASGIARVRPVPTRTSPV